MFYNILLYFIVLKIIITKIKFKVILLKKSTCCRVVWARYYRWYRPDNFSGAVQTATLITRLLGPIYPEQVYTIGMTSYYSAGTVHPIIDPTTQLTQLRCPVDRVSTRWNYRPDITFKKSH
jgi:hypothetical protein